MKIVEDKLNKMQRLIKRNDENLIMTSQLNLNKYTHIDILHIIHMLI